MAQDYTVQFARNRNKMDKFNNMTFDVKFREDERTVYAAFKTSPEEGTTKYGSIEDGQYGPRFKGAQKPEYEQSRPVSTPTPIQESFPKSSFKGSNETDNRQNEIRFQVCFKGAIDYVTKNRQNLDADQFAVEVAEYAEALYKVNRLPKSKAEEMFGEATEV